MVTCSHFYIQPPPMVKCSHIYIQPPPMVKCSHIYIQPPPMVTCSHIYIQPPPMVTCSFILKEPLGILTRPSPKWLNFTCHLVNIYKNILFIICMNVKMMAKKYIGQSFRLHRQSLFKLFFDMNIFHDFYWTLKIMKSI